MWGVPVETHQAWERVNQVSAPASLAQKHPGLEPEVRQGLENPRARDPHLLQLPDLLLKENDFPSQICACRATAALHVGCSDVSGSPPVLPGTPRVTVKSAWPNAANQSFVNRLSLSKASRAGASLLRFKVISVCSQSLTFESRRSVTNYLAQTLGLLSGQGGAQGHTISY